MRRVVVTGFGIVSSIGVGKEPVLMALYRGQSGIVHCPQYAELGLRSQVHGAIGLNVDTLIDHKLRRFMGDAAAYAYLAMRDAIADAQLPDAEIRSLRTGLVCGSAGASTANVALVADDRHARGTCRVGAYTGLRTISSTTAACLGTAFGVRGVSYSISSACATSAHCIGHGAELIQLGKQDVIFAGGGEEVHWTMTAICDGMRALSSRYNKTPQSASRPYDARRDGFVMSGGGGMVVLEELEHARARGAHVYAELVGYGATSDGYDMVRPSGEGAVRCMRQALQGFDGTIDYINAHATSTPLGDIQELKAVKEVFGERMPPISSTKSLTGHALGAAGAHEAIYSLLMMEHGFIAASANIENLDPAAADFPIVRERVDRKLDAVLSNSFGFGGANASLVFRRFDS